MGAFVGNMQKGIVKRRVSLYHGVNEMTYGKVNDIFERKILSRMDEMALQYRDAINHSDRCAKSSSRARKVARRTHLAHKIIIETAMLVEKQAHEQISSLVTKCLHAIFLEDAYQFQIKFIQRRGRTEAELTLIRDDLLLNDVVDSTGGGVLDVAGFALRLSCLLLMQPPLRKILVLDEPFKFVSKEYLPTVQSLLHLLHQETGIQVIMVTHVSQLKSGKVISLS